MAWPLAWPHSFLDCLLIVHQALGGGGGGGGDGPSGGGENGDVKLEPRLPHSSMSLVLPLPAGLEPATPLPATSAFADGELRAGTHFNALLWDPVASARFFDDRPWGGVEAFVWGVVAGTNCLSNLGGGGSGGGSGRAWQILPATSSNAFITLMY